MVRVSTIFVFLLIAGVFGLAGSIGLGLLIQKKGQIMNEQIEISSAGDLNDLTITVVYDNNPPTVAQ